MTSRTECLWLATSLSTAAACLSGGIGIRAWGHEARALGIFSPGTPIQPRTHQYRQINHAEQAKTRHPQCLRHRNPEDIMDLVQEGRDHPGNRAHHEQREHER